MKKAFKYSPARVLALYSAKNGGPINTRMLLATAMREGKLRVRAEHRWESKEPSLLRAWRNAPVFETAEDGSHRFTCNRALWWRSVRWLDDIHDWDFARGRLVVTFQIEPLNRLFLKGVRFHSGDVKKVLLGNGVNGNTTECSKFNTKDKWRTFWHEIVILAAGNRDNISSSGLAAFTGDEKLMDAIIHILSTEDDLLADKHFDDDDLSDALAARSPFDLSNEAVKQEIKALRQTLKLKSWGKNAGLKRPSEQPVPVGGKE